MLENYNLYTNIISRQNVRSIIQGDLSKWGNQYDFIKNAVKSIRDKLEMQHYLEVQHDVFQITESLRCDNEYVALKFYNTFF